MNAVVNTWSPPPTLPNFEQGIRHYYNDGMNTVHTMFAYMIFGVSEALPAKASAETLKLETARRIVALHRKQAEDGWRSQGFTVEWGEGHYEALAVQIADIVPRHPAVIARMAEVLEAKRDAVFADWSLTHGEELFVVYRWRASDADEERRTLFDEIGVLEIKEEPIVTINRSLDYMDDLSSTRQLRPYIQLKRILICLRRVHSVIASA